MIERALYLALVDLILTSFRQGWAQKMVFKRFGFILFVEGWLARRCL